MSTVAAACAVVVPLIAVAVIELIASALPPRLTVAPGWKPLPLIEMDVPPVAGPFVGVNEVIAGGGGGRNWKHDAQVPVCVSAFVTMTSIVAAACAVVVPLMAVALTKLIASALPPKLTVAPVWKPVPFTVTLVPPLPRPVFGVTDAGAGAAAYLKQPVQVALCASRFVTRTSTRPSTWAVVVPAIAVGETLVIVRADPPNEAVAPAWKPAPLIVTDVPPAIGPLEGLTDVALGAGAT